MPAYLGLGGNIGDRLANLREGVRLIGEIARVHEVSPLYETEPVGVTDQPPFYNAVCSVDTELDPEVLLDCVKAIERNVGRLPGPVWGPRPLDIDILLYDELLYVSERLCIPHARLIERAFVLRPLADLAPHRSVPGANATVKALLADVDESGVWLVAGSDWVLRAGASSPQ